MTHRLTMLFGILGATMLLGAGCIQFGASTNLGPLGVFRSNDRGESWQSTASFPTSQGVKSLAGLKIYRFFTDPSDPDAMYLGTRGQGLFYTYDRGGTWQKVDALSGMFIYGLAVDPQDKCVIYVSDGGHVYKTVDCARTWRVLYTEGRPGERFVALAVDYAQSNLIYGALSGGDILESVDGGESWQVIKRFGFTIQDLVADKFAAKRVYVASLRNGLFRTDDAGATWGDLNSGLNNYNSSNVFYRLVMHPGKKNSLFWVSKYGLLRSDDSGANWSEIKLITPPGSVAIYAFAISPKNDKEMYYVGTIAAEKSGADMSLFGSKPSVGRSTFYRSFDGGKSWVTKKMPSGATPTALYVHPLDTATLFLGFTSLD